MNETQKGTVAEGIFGIIIVFAILVFAIYKFGTSKGSVVNPDVQTGNSVQEDFDTQTNTSQENEIYNRYIKQIYEAQNATTSENKNGEVDRIISEYQQELQDKTRIPTANILMRNVSDKFTATNYKNNFEILFSDFKQRGGTSENKIIAAQILEDGTLLPLSDYDKETLLRMSSEYEIFADKVQNLSTPKDEEKIAREIATAATNIAYILKQIVNEKDKQVYTLWISKYTDNMSVIIVDRYGINQK